MVTTGTPRQSERERRAELIMETERQTEKQAKIHFDLKRKAS